jgi:DNA processing protein
MTCYFLYMQVSYKQLPINSSDYPPALKNIPDAPDYLYVKGNLEGSIFNNCLGVVGTRKMTHYGDKVLHYIISGLSCDITIVSGFMYGVDTLAHQMALACNLRTIAVLPGGINNIVPRTNHELYNNIVQHNGLIISEYSGDIEPKKWSFPKRNRLIAGISAVLLVIEATDNSGSLITAKYSHKYTRPVYAIPGNIFNVYSQGTNKLIKTGAVLLVDPSEINDYFHTSFTSEKAMQPQNPINSLQSKILQLIKSQPTHIDEIALLLKISYSELYVLLAEMQMAGLIYNAEGLYYAC